MLGDVMQKLYYDSPYIKDFVGKIVDIREIDGELHIALEQSCFYPGGGGQPADTGYFDTADVTDCYQDGGLIYHVLQSPSSKYSLSEKINGKINFDRRFAFMQNHTGEHILSGLAKSQFGATNVGFHMSECGFTMDLNIPLPKHQVQQLQDEANKVVFSAKTVEILNICGKDMSNADARAKRDFSEDDFARIVTIPSVDKCACAGLHVANTAEVGIIKIANYEKYKGGIRLHVYCGQDALWDYSRKNAIIKNIGSMISADIDGIVPALEKRISLNEALKKHCTTLQNEIFELKTANIPNKVLAYAIENRMDSKDAQRLAKMASVQAKMAVVFVSDNDTYKYVAHSENSEFLTIFFEKLNNAFEGKGSCKNGMAQGIVKAAVLDIITFLEVLGETYRI